MPHSVTQDDYYEGYFIPAKSIVFPNIKWVTPRYPARSSLTKNRAMLLDPETYPNP